MKDLEIAKKVHDELSNFRATVGGQDPYPEFSKITEHNKNLYLGAINAIRNKEIKTAEDVHDFWVKYAENHLPNHSCIVPFEELSDYEKEKDEIALDLIRNYLKS